MNLQLITTMQDVTRILIKGEPILEKYFNVHDHRQVHLSASTTMLNSKAGFVDKRSIRMGYKMVTADLEAAFAKVSEPDHFDTLQEYQNAVYGAIGVLL